jgi:hypothetical protein
MRIELFSGRETGLNLFPDLYEFGVDFEGDIWTDQEGNVKYSGNFETGDEDGNVIPLDIDPDPYELCEALNINIEDAIMEHRIDYLSYLSDTE